MGPFSPRHVSNGPNDPALVWAAPPCKKSRSTANYRPFRDPFRPNHSSHHGKLEKLIGWSHPPTATGTNHSGSPGAPKPPPPPPPPPSSCEKSSSVQSEVWVTSPAPSKLYLVGPLVALDFTGRWDHWEGLSVVKKKKEKKLVQ